MARTLSPSFSRTGLGKRTRGLQPGRSSGHRRWAWLGALAGLMLALVWFAPAAWLAQGVALASSGSVVLADARGTVWNGSAKLVLTGGAGSKDATALPERLTWTLRPSLSGLRGNIWPTCCASQAAQIDARLRWGGGQIEVTGLDMRLPAELLTGLGTPWNTLNLQGRLSLRSPQLSAQWVQGRSQIDGGLSVEMLDVSSRLSTLHPLGDYRLDLTGGASPTVDLQTLKGALQLTGRGEWVGARMRFKGEASATPEYEAELTNLLSIIGRRRDGKSIISLG
jgi:general secretion pathway protein N